MTPSVLETSEEFTPATAAELERFLAENARGSKKPVYPVGGRTALHYGHALTRPGVVVPTSGLNRVIEYPARDMTVTVEAGMRMAQLTEMLGKERQRLPIDIPQLHRATLGGVIATNASGPRRYGNGTLRDYVIGISAVDGRGRAFQAGGRVVKNVAGYDLCKLMIGSLGTLAVVTQVTLKLRPIPESSVWLWCAYPTWQGLDQALERITTTETRPAAIVAFNARAARQIADEIRMSVTTDNPTLAIALEGSTKETAWQKNRLRDELSAQNGVEINDIEDAHVDALWTATAEYSVVTDEPLTFRANVLPSRAVALMEEAERLGISVMSHAGNGIVVGHFPDEWVSWQQAESAWDRLSRLAVAGEGNMIVLQCLEEWKSKLSLWGHAESSTPLMRKLKTAFDPDGVLNPHRLFADL